MTVIEVYHSHIVVCIERKKLKVWDPEVVMAI